MADLDGRVALVTGASRGLGEGVARALAARGAAVMLVARDGAAVEAAARDIAASGGRAEAMACDVADYAAVERAVARTRSALGGLDILVNNAGVIEPIGMIGEVDPADWARLIAINLTGAYAMTHHAFRVMKAQGGGRIVNVSSGAARQPLEGWSAYCASKAGLAMLTMATDLEGAEHGIRCFGYAPGVVDTDMQAVIRASGINRVSQLPRSSLAPPDDAARLCAWLCSGAADDLAGRDVDVRDPAIRRRAGLEG